MFHSIAAATLAISVAGGAVAAELPNYEKADLPVSPVQLQVLGAANVREALPVSASATPVQFSVLTPRRKIKTAQGNIETGSRAAR
ncbi:MAG: hypothetical protein ABW175_25190 [Bradyrhizobium sp.]